MPANSKPPRKPRFGRARKVMQRVGASRVGKSFKRVWNSRTGKWVVIAAAAAGVVAGSYGVGKLLKKSPSHANGKPPIVRAFPLTHEQLHQYNVSQLEAEHLVEVIGGKHHEIIGNFEPDPTKRRKFVHSIARQWIESLDGKPDAQDPQGRLRGFRGLSARAVVNLSEVAAEISPDLSPREVTGFLATVPRLFDISKRMHAGSSGPAKAFWRDQLLRRSLKANAPEWRVIGFFDRLDKSGYRATITEIYRELGLE